MLRDFIYLKGPEKANVWIQKVDEDTRQGVGWTGSDCKGVKGDLLKEVENVLKLSTAS